MTQRILAGLFVLVLLATGTALGEDKDKDKKEPKAVKFDKPEAAFDAFAKAMRKSDFQAAHAALTPESGDKMLGTIILSVQISKAMMAAFDKEGKLAEAFKPLDEALDKAGLKKEKLEEGMKAIMEAKDDKKKADAALTKLLAPVKDKGELLGKISSTMGKLGGAKKNAFPELTLSDVKVDGDNATGKVTAKKDDKEETSTFTFKKIKGSWYVETPDDFGKGPKRSK